MVSHDLLLHPDDSDVAFQCIDKSEIEKQVKINFTNVYEWFVDSKMIVHFGEDKTGSSLFGTKCKFENFRKFNITCKGRDTKPYISGLYTRRSNFC